MLIGHAVQAKQFQEAVASGRLHHAWLLAGPKGVGKATFANAAALGLLTGNAGMDTDPEHPAARLVSASTHPDHRVLAPPEEGKGSRQQIIPIDDVRALKLMLHEHPALAEWRTIIVDSIDDMERPSANAFLKELEEPRPKTVYFLVSHSPGRLLPTIRSRCRMLRFGLLDQSDALAVLRHAMPDADEAALAGLVALAAGAPGEALRTADADIAGLMRAIDGVMHGGDAAGFARQFQPVGAIPRFDALLVLAPRRLAEAARETASVAILDAHGRASELGGSAVKLAYDRVQVAFELAKLLAEAGHLAGK